MPIITLPDGNNLTFPDKVTGLDVAEKISKSLAKQAMVISIDGDLKDLDFLIEKDCSIKIFTSKNPEGLETIRHDTAHILAMAVQELFPGTQVTIGPVIENGFYYDFARKEPFTEDDLEQIENKMKEIVDRNEITKREVWERDKAIKHFKEIGEHYKSEIIRDIPKNEEVSIYHHGKWHDLCRGPHVESTAKLRWFKLTSTSQAYWRADAKRESLVRIYGMCYASKNNLKERVKQLAEAEKRDHKKISKEMNLYMINELIGKGLPVWLPNGEILKSEIKGFDATLLTASEKIDESTTTISKSVESISEASSQLNSLLFPIIASIGIIVALQITIIARRR